MTSNRTLLVACTAVSLSASSVCFAGPCSLEITHAQEEVNSYLGNVASAGTRAHESVRALMHRQPTPATIAAAEVAIGELDASVAQAIVLAMLRARDFDARGDEYNCLAAVQDVYRAIAGKSGCGRSRCE